MKKQVHDQLSMVCKHCYRLLSRRPDGRLEDFDGIIACSGLPGDVVSFHELQMRGK